MPEPSPCETITLVLSDAAIKRHAADPTARQLRDSRRPLVLRYRTDRTRGSWYLVTYKAGQNPWLKIGNWPDLSASAVSDALPALQARLAIDARASSTVDGWQTVGQLLEWFSDRVCRDRNKSLKRKDTTRSIIKCHLRPRLAGVPLSAINRGLIDEQLIWPLQERYSLAYLRQVFGVLVQAFKQAHTLKLLTVNPVADWKFPEFIAAEIKPKPAFIRPDQVGDVLARLIQCAPFDVDHVALAVMMLSHGTRLGETRLAKWQNVNLTTREWFIPAADTKTGVELIHPLTDQLCAFLTRYRTQQKASHYVGAYLFPARNGKPINPKQASEIFKGLGLGEWTSHDLRKVARTVWVDLGIDWLVGESLLNHTVKGVAAAYIHTTLKPLRRDALERYHAWLDALGFAQLHGGWVGFGGETVARQPESSFTPQPHEPGACRPV